MNKNTKTYLLLAAVILIWGIVIYKIVSAGAEEPDIISNVAIDKLEPLASKERDTFSITAEYRDPFLGTMAKKKVKTTKRTTKPKKPPQPEINIRYTGLITDQDTKSKIFFVSINGQQHLMSANDEVQKVRLLSGTESSIRVHYNGKTKSVALQK